MKEVSNSVLLSGSKNERNFIQTALEWLLFTKNYKKCPSAGGFVPQTFVCDSLETITDYRSLFCFHSRQNAHKNKTTTTTKKHKNQKDLTYTKLRTRMETGRLRRDLLNLRVKIWHIPNYERERKLGGCEGTFSIFESSGQPTDTSVWSLHARCIHLFEPKNYSFWF